MQSLCKNIEFAVELKEKMVVSLSYDYSTIY